jgi:hypothetical protein
MAAIRDQQVSCTILEYFVYLPHLCKQFFFRQLRFCIYIHIGFNYAYYQIY